jgi:hypothetical protein
MTDQTTQTTTTTGTTQTAAATTGALEQLVGEGKKFKTQEDLAVGKLESDKFISKLSDENKELKTLLTGMATDLEALKQRNTFQARTSNDDDTSNNDPSQATDNAKPTKATVDGITPADVLKLMEQREADKAKRANMAQVDAALTKEFGAEAKNFVIQKAAELGLPQEYLITTAQASPSAFFNLVGFLPQESRNTGLTSRVSGVSGGTVTSSGGSLRDGAFYAKLSKEMGAWKFATDTKLQLQMYKDMQQLGDRFSAG